MLVGKPGVNVNQKTVSKYTVFNSKSCKLGGYICLPTGQNDGLGI